ncbi:hypothetical protein IWX50DRAFT_614004 [Phyllosticta citricarpa]|uniref:Uncharacterized protein n=1 Tax=Phyllosticta citricarpa TaxID=55181 RepID=A0ABR1MIQ2_9PEZI
MFHTLPDREPTALPQHQSFPKRPSFSRLPNLAWPDSSSAPRRQSTTNARLWARARARAPAGEQAHRSSHADARKKKSWWMTPSRATDGWKPSSRDEAIPFVEHGVRMGVASIAKARPCHATTRILTRSRKITTSREASSRPEAVYENDYPTLAIEHGLAAQRYAGLTRKAAAEQHGDGGAPLAVPPTSTPTPTLVVAVDDER